MNEKHQDQLREMAKALPSGSTMRLHDVAIGPLPGQRVTVVILADKDAVPDGVDLTLAAAHKLLEAHDLGTTVSSPAVVGVRSVNTRKVDFARALMLQRSPEAPVTILEAVPEFELNFPAQGT